MPQKGSKATRLWFFILFMRMMKGRSDEKKNWNRKVTISVFIQLLFRWKVTAILPLHTLYAFCIFYRGIKVVT